jgi:hypothetical protein
MRIERTGDDVSLHDPEGRLALVDEDLGHGFARFGLDHLVTVTEGHSPATG